MARIFVTGSRSATAVTPLPTAHQGIITDQNKEMKNKENTCGQEPMQGKEKKGAGRTLMPYSLQPPITSEKASRAKEGE